MGDEAVSHIPGRLSLYTRKLVLVVVSSNFGLAVSGSSVFREEGVVDSTELELLQIGW